MNPELNSYLGFSLAFEQSFERVLVARHAKAKRAKARVADETLRAKEARRRRSLEVKRQWRRQYLKRPEVRKRARLYSRALRAKKKAARMRG